MATIRRRSWTTAQGEARESWQVDFSDQSGRRRHRQFKTRKEADAFMVQARAQVAEGVYSPDSSSPTVTAAAVQWIERCEREQLEPITVGGYRSLVQRHVGPLLGKRKLSPGRPDRRLRRSSTNCWRQDARVSWRAGRWVRWSA